ncbi:MAG: ABC transporter permease [Chitinophagales bacterium]
MWQNYFKIALRNLSKNKLYAFINIGGLAVGMAVAMLFGLWIWDEISFNRYHKNYARIAQVYQKATNNGQIFNSEYLPIPLGSELQNSFNGYFKHVVMSSFSADHILSFGENGFVEKGIFLGVEGPEMLSLKMLQGTQSGLKDISSVLLSESTAKSIFGKDDPFGKSLRIDNQLDVKVCGVYEDLPLNTQFSEIKFIAPWDLYVATNERAKQATEQADWRNNSWQILAEIAPGADFENVSSKTRDIISTHSSTTSGEKPQVFLHPMAKWHLYTSWDKNGYPAQGRSQYVWLFAIIGFFVLLLACINFMNLSTARSEKRAKEVGIRKTLGSFQSQLIGQFYSESLLVISIAFISSLLLVSIGLPWFNNVADKQLVVLWNNPVFWMLGLGVSLFTMLVAGSYPAFYLSSFEPLKVLKGNLRMGRFSATPRKVLMMLQFTASIALIVGTAIVYQQIQFVKNRTIGYSRDGLISLNINSPEILEHYEALRNDLINSNAILEMCTSSSPTTAISSNDNWNWGENDPARKTNFGTIAVTHDYGKTVGWHFKKGRDFSRQFSTDSAAVVINETAAKYIGNDNPIGLHMKWAGKEFTVIGVIEDMIMESPFRPVHQTVFHIDYNWANVIIIKINPLNVEESLQKIGAFFSIHNPGIPFEYAFVDTQYAQKFNQEERIGKLASFIALLAIFVCCLGLFGLASFMAEQRTKEIGIRKVLGASVFNVWRAMSKEFVLLVVIACFIATPTTYYFLHNWLNQYEYHTQIPWWLFAVATLGALSITLLTVGFQSVQVALLNPVKSLRSE